MKIQTPIDRSDETLADRKQHVVDWLTRNAKHARDTDTQNARTLRYIYDATLPAGWLRPSHDEQFDTYKRACGCGQFQEYLLSDRETIEQRLEDRQNSTTPPNMPQDGSKGQWRAAKKNDIIALRWLLDGNENGVYGRIDRDPFRYKMGVYDGVTFRTGDFVSHAIDDSWLVGQIEAFGQWDDAEKTPIVYLNHSTTSPIPLSQLRPEVDDWMESLLRASCGKPFTGKEGDKEVEWHERPYLKDDVVRIDSDDVAGEFEPPIFGRITKTSVKDGTPLYDVITSVMEDPPTYEDSYGGARNFYSLVEGDLTHADEVDDVSALKDKHKP